MSERLLVCTRKGLFVYARGTAGWSVSHEAFLGVPVPMALHDPQNRNLFAALAHGHFGCKLHRSGDGGATWDEIAMPAFPFGTGGANGDGPAVSLVWALEAAGSDAPETLWAGTIPGGLFVSKDRGESWTLVRGLWDLPERANWFGGGYDDPGIHSIAIDPRDSRRIVLAVSCGGVWLSEDGGDTWTARTRGMKAPYVPPERAEDAAIQDPHRLVQCPAQPDRFWVQHHAGIYRSTDGLESWSQLEGVAVSDFGFAVAVHPDDPDTAWFVPATADEKRYPVDARLVVTRTRDGGANFETLAEGFPPPPVYDLVYRHGLDVGADGRTLAMGSTTGGLWITEDGGESWTTVSLPLPPIYGVRLF